MEAIASSFKRIVSDENFLEVPFFQRKYVWKKEQWEQLFDDLKASVLSRKEHFLGSVILKRNSGNRNFANIIDGQQRITTFSILIKAAYDELKDEQKKHFDPLLIEDYTDNDPKIKHCRVDRKIYTQIIQGVYSSGQKNEKNLKEGLLDCLEYFKIRIKEIDDVFDFLKFITDKSKLFVKVNLESTEDEQKIFDSINSTGMPLNATDIIKNALFDRMIKISDEEYALDLYDKYWRNIFEHDDKCLQFWDSQITTGRIKRSQSEIFLHAFALIIGIFDTDKHSLSDLSSVFKTYIQNKSKEELEDFLVLLAKYAQTYQKLPQITQNILFDFDEYENRFFHLGYCFGINSFLPLVLFLKQNLEEDEYKKALYLLEMTVLCVSETKNYNKFVADIISNLQNNLKNTYIYIREQIKKYYVKFFEHSQIKEWLNNIENNDAKVVLFWIELYRQREAKDYKDKTGLCYIYTLEHLAPQKWQENWSDIFKNEEEADKFIYKIGNMTLLKGRFNTALQNAAWTDKLNGNNKYKHYIKKYADLIINKELLNITQWNKATIEQRTVKIINDFYKIWNVNIFLEENNGSNQGF